MNNLEEFIAKLKKSPNALQFEDTMSIIALMYDFSDTAFSNGNVDNKAGENSGSCRLFAFAKQHNLSEEQALSCFGQYYQDVLASPEGDSHQNIRQFMLHGWDGIVFQQDVLTLK